MQFLIHGPVHPEVQAALAGRRHACHAMPELTAETDAPAEMADDPAVLLKTLEKRQWNLVTADSGLVHAIYEQKVPFGGVIVHILDDPAVVQDQGAAIGRLFERYKRLTPRRLYTVTASRVKIRQLPGGHA